LATFPLAVYYFHQFPNYFLLSNLLALPLAPALLVLGIFTLLLSFVPGLGDALGYLLRTLIETLNMVIVELSKLPWAVSKGIYLHQVELWLIYLSLLSFLLVFQYKRLVYLKLSLLGVLAAVGWQCYHTQQCQKQVELAIFSLNKYPHIQFTQGTQSVFIAQPTLQHDQKTLGFNIDSYLWSKGVKERLFLDDAHSQHHPKTGFAYRKKGKYALMLWKNKSFLILQKYLRHRELKAFKNIQTDYLVVQNKAVWSIAKLCEFIQPRHLIIDDSNGFYRGRKLHQEAQKAGIRCTWIGEGGAFILRE
jgi:competence protein ComEC